MKWNLSKDDESNTFSNGLTPKQFTFYNNLIEQMKETGKMDVKQAALSAGFSPRNYSSIASRLLKKREGQAYLKSLQRESTHSAISNLDWVMKKRVRIVRAGIADDGTITAKYVKDSLRMISEINKIQGRYTPEKNFSFNMEMDDLQETKLLELILKYEREY
jgi:phage terminase small subunit